VVAASIPQLSSLLLSMEFSVRSAVIEKYVLGTSLVIVAFLRVQTLAGPLSYSARAKDTLGPFDIASTES